MKLSNRDMLNSFPKTMLFIEAERSASREDTTTHKRHREREAIVALGVMAILIVLSFYQLHRCLDITQAQPEINREKKLSLVRNSTE